MAPARTLAEDSVVKSSLNFWLDPALGGHTAYTSATVEKYKRKFDEHEVEIHDARGWEDGLSLDTHGFCHHRHISAEKDFLDDEQVKRIVYPETEELIKEVTGATRVHTFSHIIRRDSREASDAKLKHDPSMKDDKVVVPFAHPARNIHIDFSYDGAEEMLNDNLPPEIENLEHLKKCRWGIMNVWRPIKPISKDPLALCDARTANDEDLKPISVSLPKSGNKMYSQGALSKGAHFELFYLKYQPEQKWYYVSSMQPEEVLLLKIYDSIQDGKTARRVPHSAFINPATEADPTRESIEVRCFVFYEDQPV